MNTFSHYSYNLSLWRRAVLEKRIVPHLFNIFFALYATLLFITLLTEYRHFSVSRARSTKSTSSHFVSWRSIFILSSPLYLGLPSGLFPSNFPLKILYAPLPSTCYMLRPSYSPSFDHQNNMWLGVLIVKPLPYAVPTSSLLTSSF